LIIGLYSVAQAATPAGIQSPTVTPTETPSAIPSADQQLQALSSYQVVPVVTSGATTLQSVRIGDRIELIIAGISGVSGPALLELPAGSSSLSDQGWAIVKQPFNDSNSTSPGLGLRFSVVPLKTGELILPPLLLKNKEGLPFARTQPWKISVVSAIRSDDPAPQKSVPLKPPVSLIFPWWAMTFIGGLILVILTYAVYRVIRWSRDRKKPIEAVLPAAPPLTEDELALAALIAVEREELDKNGQFKKHYFRISEILKNYIGDRFGFDAPESTSREILVLLKRKKIDSLRSDQEEIERLEALFSKLDLVKFTDHSPLLEEPAQILGEARDFVMNTRRLKVVAPSEEGATS